MSNIRLPISHEKVHSVAAKQGIEKDDAGFAVRDWINRTLVDEYSTFVQTFFYAGTWWVRFSGQVYLEMRDFEWAAQALKKMCERVKKGEWAAVKSKL